ncbi:hypothetical protein [Pectobacterium carotovorum]|uniref:hypothetical protein n=1 Tax=Pectobacterium carotovorum TaxID=554 RepID=UPI001314C32F|nr:hypothetical protein [Pectobacterium carotovorum]
MVGKPLAATLKNVAKLQHIFLNEYYLMSWVELKKEKGASAVMPVSRLTDWHYS